MPNDDVIIRDDPGAVDVSGPMVNVRKPSGGIIGVTREQAEKFLSLEGYSLEGSNQGRARRREDAEEEYFTSTTERILTGVEGLGRGLSLGLTAGLETDRSQLRAEYNPGTAITTEIVGAIAPVLLSGGAAAPEAAVVTGGRLAGAVRGARAALGATPAGLLAKGGLGVERALGGGIRGMAAAGAVEGAVAAGVGGVARGDPETVEHIFAGAGLGGLLGAGAGALSRGARALKTGRDAAAAGRAVDELSAASVAEGMDDLRLAGDDLRTAYSGARRVVTPSANEAASIAALARHWGDEVLEHARDVRRGVPRPTGLVGKADNAAVTAPVRGQARGADATVPGVPSMTLATAPGGLGRSPSLAGRAAADAADTEISAVTRATAAGTPPVPTTGADEIMGLERDIARGKQQLLRGGDAGKMRDLIAGHVEKVTRLAQITGAKSPGEEFFGAVTRFQDSFTSGKAGAALPAPGDLFRGDPGDWLSRPTAVDAIVAAAKLPTGGPVKAAVEKMARALGVEPSGDLAVTMAQAAAARKSLGKGVRLTDRVPLHPTDPAGGSKPTTVDRLVRGGLRNAAAGLAAHVAHGGVAGILARQAVYAGGGYLLAGESGAVLAGTLAGMRAGVTKRIAALVERLGPGLATAARSSASPLGLSLTGQWDADSNRVDRAELFRRRSEEITNMAPVARDLLYTAAAASEGSAPGLSVGVVEKGGEMVDAMAAALPRDNGAETSFFDSDWSPTPRQLDIFEDVYQALMDPLGALERGIDEGATPEMAKTLNERFPDVIAKLRLEFIGRAKELAGTMDLESRSALSVLLDYPIDPLCSPQGIAFFQAAFEPTEAPPSANQATNTNGGRPAGPGKPIPPTAAQAATNRT